MSILKRTDERSLLVLVLDISPVVWRMRKVFREKSDSARFAKGKTTVGPTTLDETLDSFQAFCGAFINLQRDCAIVIIGVAGNETAVLFPRKNTLQEFFKTGVIDVRHLRAQFLGGVAEVVSRPGAAEDTAAIAAGLSIALCVINRFLVVNNGGVSALTKDGTVLFRKDDDGVVALMGGTKRRKTSQAGGWSTRILIAQASNDRSKDYNAIMNCAFAAVKHDITIDGCFIPSTTGKDPKNSSFLEQACDRTGGVYLAPSGMAQVGPSLTEILFAIFLAPLSARRGLALPAINKVDFRARCFETGETVSLAFVCNQCLSIFKKCPKDVCKTCGADVIVSKKVES